jgi:hypothetical protein
MIPWPCSWIAARLSGGMPSNWMNAAAVSFPQSLTGAS